MLTTIVTALLAFAATNIDDILLLTMWFGSAGGSLQGRHIVAGQYLGFAALVAVSLLGALGALLLPREYIGFLGFLPIALGILALRRGGEDEEEEGVMQRISGASGSRGGGLFAPPTWTVAAVTIANGADNLSVYVPLFAATPPTQLGVMVLVFFALVAVWCFAGARLAELPAVARTISRYGDVLVPFVLLGLGAFILWESGALGVMLRALGIAAGSG